MELKKREAYHGYEAYSYLERGVDYPAVEWAQWDWAGRHVVDLDPAEEERVARILADNPFVSLHEHPTFYPADMSSMNSIYDAMRDGRQAKFAGRCVNPLLQACIEKPKGKGPTPFCCCAPGNSPGLRTGFRYWHLKAVSVHRSPVG